MKFNSRDWTSEDKMYLLVLHDRQNNRTFLHQAHSYGFTMYDENLALVTSVELTELAKFYHSLNTRAQLEIGSTIIDAIAKATQVLLVAGKPHAYFPKELKKVYRKMVRYFKNFFRDLDRFEEFSRQLGRMLTRFWKQSKIYLAECQKLLVKLPTELDVVC